MRGAHGRLGSNAGEGGGVSRVSRVYLYSGARVDELDEPAEHVRVGLRQDAVAEVEDVARPAAGPGEHVERRRLDPLPRAEQERRDRGCPARRAPALRRPSRGRAARASRGRSRRRRRARGARAAARRRRCRNGSSARRPRRGSAPSTARRTPRSRQARATPTQESNSWIDVGAGARLRRDVARELLGEALHQRVPHGRLAIHERLRAGEVAARLALDEIAGDGERAAAEADHGTVGVELARARCARPRGSPRPTPPARRRAAARRRPGTRSGARRRGRRLRRARRSTPMPSTGDMMSANITAASTPCRRTGCKRHLRAELRRPGDLEEAVALADRAVLRQRAPGLSHEPDRRALDRLAPCSPDEEWLRHAPTLAPP